jgi:hypothetical protein
VVFHYKPHTLERIEPYLSKASDDVSFIEFGEGRYLDTRYEFADAVFEELVLDVWGRSEQELTLVLEEMVKLVLALTYFAHEALAIHLARIGRDPIEVER